ncbi:MAG: HPr family phosphocarrier protein [Bacteroides sp.]|nr:HPr family phosphocarrier protein [Eubacterium sp.]MCM1418813.1 HPr family phosphocarrier protein [Roseburia sp.]MCM1462086.1 HPr family phosphocarrier protein [Bacteroides sp.]
MKEFKVKITTIDDVKKFVSTIMLFDYEVDLVSGRYAIDAKSIMGIFSIDLSKELKLVAHTDDTAELEEAIADYIIK